VREKVGVLWGNPEVTPGGRALKFYSSVRIDLRRIESIKQAQEIVGSRVRARVVKNKVAPPFRVAEFDIMFKEGISYEGDLIELGDDTGVVTKRGAFYSFGDTRLGQGRENSKAFLREHPEVAGHIEAQIRKTLEPEAPPVLAETAGGE
jgi:recombination protein RecA